jgi:hypothetical protein
MHSVSIHKVSHVPSTDDIPPDISVSQPASEDRGSSTKCKHDRAQHCQLIIHVPTLTNITSLKRQLQAAAAHPEGHCITMYIGRHVTLLFSSSFTGLSCARLICKLGECVDGEKGCAVALVSYCT